MNSSELTVCQEMMFQLFLNIYILAKSDYTIYVHGCFCAENQQIAHCLHLS